jgi:SAM-dependent methyltransferase
MNWSGKQPAISRSVDPVDSSNAPALCPTAFDEYADNYDAALEEGLSATGENKVYFAKGRIDWLAGRVRALGFTPRSILDFGCGTGSATPYLLGVAGAESSLGVDISPKSLETARRVHGSERARFALVDPAEPNGGFDLAFCNGVFHHIPVAERGLACDYVFRSLRPGGLFAFWENNPWNPGTRFVMARCPFDQDAITLSPPSARSLLAAQGFEVVRTDYLFIFPRALRMLRWIEPNVSRLPLGAQYQILCRKPAGAPSD